MTQGTLRDLRIAATCNVHGLTQAEVLSLINEVERLQEGERKAMARAVRFACEPSTVSLGSFDRGTLIALADRIEKGEVKVP